jgi:4-hydroxybenzoate polyprenyltransferase
MGVRNALWLAALSHALAVGCLVGLWSVAHLGTIFLVGVIAVAILLTYEHSIVRADDLSRVNVAFFNVNAVISLGLLVIGTLDAWMTRGG